jgi:hypothetical protein
VALATAAERLAPLGDLAGEMARRFPELGYLGPHGILSVPVDVGAVTSLRLELPRQFLHLQSIGLVATDGSDAAAGAQVTVSSWYGTYEDRFDAARLFDWDHPSGTTVHTLKDELSWLEVSFPRPVRLEEVRLRNVGNATAARASRLKVSARTRWRRHVLFDGATRHEELATLAGQHSGPPDPDVDALMPVLLDTFRGAYPEAKRRLADLDLDPEVVKAFKAVVNETLLPSRDLLWTIHGPCRSFRFWSPEEKESYVRFSVEVVDALRAVTPHVSFGFGAVLSVVRDRALIPHDDDLDVIIGFEPEEARTLAEGLRIVEAALKQAGFSVRGNYSAHRQVARSPRGKHVDVFVGLFEGDAISWYPGTRGALDRKTMYPTITAPLLGVECPIPAQPEAYLATLYGEGWRSPDPHFAHRWDRSAYADLAGGAATPTP